MGRKEKDIPLSLEDINNLVSGMWLNCLTMKVMRTTMIQCSWHQILQEWVLILWGVHIKIILLVGIGVEYDNNEIDDDEEEQKRIPINWCKYDNAHSTWPCDISSQDSTDSKSCEYMMIDDHEALFHVHLRTWVRNTNTAKVVVIKGIYFSLTANMKEWSRMMMGI